MGEFQTGFLSKKFSQTAWQNASTSLLTSHPPHLSRLHRGLLQPDGCWWNWSWQLPKKLPHRLSSRQLCCDHQLHLHLHLQADSRGLDLCDKVMHPMLPHRWPNPRIDFFPPCLFKCLPQCYSETTYLKFNCPLDKYAI